MSEDQLELFDVQRSTQTPGNRHLPGRFIVQMRHDQLVLGAMGLLIGLTVIFGAGVERGKQLARAERSATPSAIASGDAQHSKSKPPSAQIPASVSESKPVGAPAAVPDRVVPAKTPQSVAKAAAKTQASPKKATPSKDASGRYAVQVVTYSQAQRARREIEHLKQKGNPAFFVLRGSHAVVYVGPFTSKGNATKRLSQLKSRYRDCFLKVL